MIEDKKIENEDLENELDEEEIDEEELADLEEVDDEIDGEDDLGIESPIDHEDGLEEDPEPDDAEEYGTKVKKRIGREVKKTKIQENKTRQVERERDLIRESLQREQKSKVELQIKYNEEKKKRLTEDIARNNKIAADALEKGETDDYMKLNDRIVSDKVELSRAEDFHVEVPEAPAPQPEDDMADEAKSWLGRNRAWVNRDPTKFARAQRLSKVLRREGYDVDSPEMYDELDARLNDKPKKRSQPLNDPSKNALPVREKTKGLTREDKQNMQKFGLNPNNAEDRKNWINGKGASI